MASRRAWSSAGPRAVMGRRVRGRTRLVVGTAPQDPDRPRVRVGDSARHRTVPPGDQTGPSDHPSGLTREDASGSRVAPADSMAGAEPWAEASRPLRGRWCSIRDALRPTGHAPSAARGLWEAHRRSRRSLPDAQRPTGPRHRAWRRLSSGTTYPEVSMAGPPVAPPACRHRLSPRDGPSRSCPAVGPRPRAWSAVARARGRGPA